MLSLVSYIEALFSSCDSSLPKHNWTALVSCLIKVTQIATVHDNQLLATLLLASKSQHGGLLHFLTMKVRHNSTLHIPCRFPTSLLFFRSRILLIETTQASQLSSEGTSALQLAIIPGVLLNHPLFLPTKPVKMKFLMAVIIFGLLVVTSNAVDEVQWYGTHLKQSNLITDVLPSDGDLNDDNLCCILNFSRNQTSTCSITEVDTSYLVDVHNLFEEDPETMRCPNITSHIPQRSLSIPYCTQQIYQIAVFEKEGCHLSGMHYYMDDVQPHTCLSLGFSASSYHIGLVDPNDREDGGYGCDRKVDRQCGFGKEAGGEWRNSRKAGSGINMRL